jgi:hypothetical protein
MFDRQNIVWDNSDCFDGCVNRSYAFDVPSSWIRR